MKTSKKKKKKKKKKLIVTGSGAQVGTKVKTAKFK